MEKIKRFWVQLRKARRLAGQSLRYVYVTEGVHGDERLHHHVVIDGTGGDLETLQSLWPHGEVHIEYVDAYGYEALAKYLTRERNAAAQRPAQLDAQPGTEKARTGKRLGAGRRDAVRTAGRNRAGQRQHDQPVGRGQVPQVPAAGQATGTQDEAKTGKTEENSIRSYIFRA